MEIIKRVKPEALIVSNTESESNVRDEVNRRTCKAGYTDKDGQPVISRATCYGKGDSYRKINKNLYDTNYVKIFKHE
jgi:hypothetical protein